MDIHMLQLVKRLSVCESEMIRLKGLIENATDGSSEWHSLKRQKQEQILRLYDCRKQIDQLKEEHPDAYKSLKFNKPKQGGPVKVNLIKAFNRAYEIFEKYEPEFKEMKGSRKNEKEDSKEEKKD